MLSFALCLMILRGMTLDHACGMPLTSANNTAFEAEIAAGPSCTDGQQLALVGSALR